MQKLAIDIGYGHVKYIVDGNVGKFPTAVARKKSVIAEFEDLNSYSYMGNQYFVGDIDNKSNYLTRSYDFLSKFAPLLLYVAIEKSGLDITKPIEITTGLSLLNWKNRDGFAQTFHSNKAIVNGCQLTDDSNVLITPQGKGVYLDYCNQNTLAKSQKNIIIDIGYNTLDVLVFDNNKPLLEECWSNDNGISLIIKKLGNYLTKEYGVSWSEQKLNNLLETKTIFVSGQEKDISIIIEDIVTDYADEILNKVLCDISDLETGKLNIVIAGGGAYIIKDFYSDSRVTYLKDSEFSNVKGYWSLLDE